MNRTQKIQALHDDLMKKQFDLCGYDYENRSGSVADYTMTEEQFTDFKQYCLEKMRKSNLFYGSKMLKMELDCWLGNYSFRVV